MWGSLIKLRPILEIKNEMVDEKEILINFKMKKKNRNFQD